MSFGENLGRAVGKLRNAADYLSQESLALRCGLSANYVGEIERGLVNPSADTIEKLARGLGSTTLFLVRMAEGERILAAASALKEPRATPRQPSVAAKPPPLRYLIVIEKAPGGYSAYCPDLPFCGAIAATREAVKVAIDRDITAQVNRLRQAGKIIGPATSVEWCEVPV
ncbi:MAG: helix-turn-helix domain-containing protein [Gemmatimonadales bacterium]